MEHNADGKILGHPTEGAMMAAAQKVWVGIQLVVLGSHTSPDTQLTHSSPLTCLIHTKLISHTSLTYLTSRASSQTLLTCVRSISLECHKHMLSGCCQLQVLLQLSTNRLRDQFVRTEERSFNSQQKWMAVHVGDRNDVPRWLNRDPIV